MAGLDLEMLERPTDDEPGLPRLTVNNMIKEILPDVKVSKESKDLIINCCSEFIHLISTEANELAEKSKKAHTLITPEHVIKAIENLGFTEYLASVKLAHKGYKDQCRKKKSKPSINTQGKTVSELQEQQKMLFEYARMEQWQLEQAEYMKGMNDNSANLNYGQFPIQMTYNATASTNAVSSSNIVKKSSLSSKESDNNYETSESETEDDDDDDDINERN